MIDEIGGWTTAGVGQAYGEGYSVSGFMIFCVSLIPEADRFSILSFWLSCFQALNASVIDFPTMNNGKAFGFMLFGNDGFMTPGIENLAVDGWFEKSFYSRNSKDLCKL